ncbi:MAG: hypothetical protein OEZ40_08385, partial [Candidatus Bathyarchaeota archaeon]|nr:hypothetical protein [Candidatus Bathyarchaeota archaeon]
IRDVAWSDEKRATMLILELEDWRLPGVKKHLGPPLEKERECENFVGKYVNNRNVVSGPYISNGRWVVEVRRKFTDVRDLLDERLKDGGRNAGMAEGISKTLKKGYRILVNEEIVKPYARNGEFAEFLTEFLSGKPKWLENA